MSKQAPKASAMVGRYTFERTDGVTFEWRFDGERITQPSIDGRGADGDPRWRSMLKVQNVSDE